MFSSSATPTVPQGAAKPATSVPVQVPTSVMHGATGSGAMPVSFTVQPQQTVSGGVAAKPSAAKPSAATASAGVQCCRSPSSNAKLPSSSSSKCSCANPDPCAKASAFHVDKQRDMVPSQVAFGSKLEFTLLKLQRKLKGDLRAREAMICDETMPSPSKKPRGGDRKEFSPRQGCNGAATAAGMIMPEVKGCAVPLKAVAKKAGTKP